MPCLLQVKVNCIVNYVVERKEKNKNEMFPLNLWFQHFVDGWPSEENPDPVSAIPDSSSKSLLYRCRSNRPGPRRGRIGKESTVSSSVLLIREKVYHQCSLGKTNPTASWCSFNCKFLSVADKGESLSSVFFGQN